MLKSLAVCLALFAAPALAAPQVGEKAPDFEAKATSGAPIRLADMNGRKIVLEWTNDGCPFVRKHYETGNMQKTQRAAKAKGAAWITIISSAPGKQGYLTADEADALTAKRNAAPDYVILDPSGEIGRLYGAKTTPHMFVIDEEGVLRYAGAIDDKPSANHATVEGAKNYVLAALDDLSAGRAVATPVTNPYGCSVKYAD